MRLHFRYRDASSTDSHEIWHYVRIFPYQLAEIMAECSKKGHTRMAFKPLSLDHAGRWLTS